MNGLGREPERRTEWGLVRYGLIPGFASDHDPDKIKEWDEYASIRENGEGFQERQTKEIVRTREVPQGHGHPDHVHEHDDAEACNQEE